MGFFNTVKWLSALLLALMLALPAAGHCEPSGLLEVYFMDLGRVDGILIRCGGAVSFIDVGFHSDARLATRWLNAMGIETEPIREDKVNGGRFTFFRDPDNLPLELHE